MLILIICAIHFSIELDKKQLDQALRAISIGKDPFTALNMVHKLSYVPEFISFRCNKSSHILTFNYTCDCGFTEQYNVQLTDIRPIICPNCKKVTSHDPDKCATTVKNK